MKIKYTKKRKKKVDLVHQSCRAPQITKQHPFTREDLAKSSMAYSKGKGRKTPCHRKEGGNWVVMGYDFPSKK